MWRLSQQNTVVLMCCAGVLAVSLNLYRSASSMIAQSHITTGTISTKETSIHYHWHPEKFTTVVADCILDDSCRLLLNHVQKTGGTTIERLFFKMMPPEINLPDFTAEELVRTDPSRMFQFKEHPDAYCEQAKFSSYQITGDGSYFKDVAKKCLEITDTQRFVLLTPYREPISRTLSYIHQMCNKKIGKREEILTNACQRCNYDDNDDVDENARQDKQVWDGFVNMTNNQYSTLADFDKNLKYDLMDQYKDRSVDVLMLDTSDLTNFLQRLDDTLVAAQKTTLRRTNKMRVPLQSGVHNKERLDVCSFGLKSQMIKGLKTASFAYRELNLSS